MRKQEPLGQVYGSMQDAYWQMQTPLSRQETSTQVCMIVVFLSAPPPAVKIFDIIKVDSNFLEYNS